MLATRMFSRNMERFRLITFDVTDTLLKFKTAPAIQYAKTASFFGIDIDQHRLSQCFRTEFRSMSHLHPNFGCLTQNMTWQQWWIQLVYNIFHCTDPSIPSQKLNIIAKQLLEEYRTNKCWLVIDGAEELIMKFREMGKIVGVISNSDPSLKTLLEAMKMLNLFDFILTSYDCQVQKPNPSIFQIPLEKYNVSASEALHIGNLYEIDYLGARNARWSSLLLAKEIPSDNNLHPTQIHQSLRSLINSLETKEIVW